jgi:hypothetical protein
MFPIRFLSPLIAIGIAGYYFLPETSRNIVNVARRYEEHVPALYTVHQKISRDIEQLKNETVKEVEQVTDKLGITKSP